MDFAFTLPLGKLAVLYLAYLLLIGPGYAWLLNHERFEWLAKEATELSVVIGVLLTLAPLLLVLPWTLVVIVFLAFAANGIWQALRSAYNRHRGTNAVRSRKAGVLGAAEAVQGTNGTPKKERAR